MEAQLAAAFSHIAKVVFVRVGCERDGALCQPVEGGVSRARVRKKPGPQRARFPAKNRPVFSREASAYIGKVASTWTIARVCMSAITHALLM
jgi:hypothetical protein